MLNFHLRYFYQHKKLATLDDGDVPNSIIRAAGISLAVSCKTRKHHIEILGTDSFGSVGWTRSTQDHQQRCYSPYGYRPTKINKSLSPAFKGESFDSLSNSYPLGCGHRSYAPELTRFITPDSSSPFGDGGLNRYFYCSGDPVNYSDPSGRARVFMANGQILVFNKNKSMANAAGRWLRKPGFDIQAHKTRLIESTLAKPRRTKAVKSPSSAESGEVYELFRNPINSTEKVHVRGQDMNTFKRNRAEIKVHLRLHFAGADAPRLNYLKRASALMNENESLAIVGEKLWLEAGRPGSTDAMPLAGRASVVRTS